MKRQRMCRLVLVLLMFGGSASSSAGQQERPTPRQQAARPDQRDVRLTGEVLHVHAPRVFTVRERGEEARELLVLSPRPLKSGFAGATVIVEGTLRRFREADVDRAVGLGEIDRETRRRLVSRPVLVASSVLAIGRGERALQEFRPAAPAPAPAAPRAPAERERAVSPRADRRQPRPITVRTAMMVANLEAFAGRQVRVQHGRIVGVLEPHAFLIEPATPHLKRMGDRDRVLVLIRSAALRAPAELLVGSTVTVTGIARTLVGVQVMGEVPWPVRLRPEAVDRLEVRAAILATSVQSPDGVELTDALLPAAARK